MANNLPSSWIQEYPYDLTIEIISGLARLHAEAAGELGVSITEALDRRDYAAICDFELDYGAGNPDPESLAHVRQALAFFQKLEPLELGLDKEAEAFEKFEAAECKCRGTNWIWSNHALLGCLISPDVAAVFHRTQRLIALALGPVPTLDSLDFSFGPGANTTVNASVSNPRFKLGARLACSSELASSVQTLLAEAPQWCLVHDQKDSADPENFYRVAVEIHPGRLQFVPKNAKTYRSIVIEPILNSFAQKGIGKFLRERLHRYGVNLKDQTRNQNLARVGSLDNSLATLDLSAASDTISKEVVASLLPLDWYSFLSRFRTGKVSYQGEILTLEKFSSMGNAFTFELESLIFWALSRSTCEHLGLSVVDVSVYGDDIIVPSQAAVLLGQVLNVAGFSVNERKSFVDGPFRESCGSDWFRGFDVRPFYQKTLITAETLFSLHNFYARRFEFSFCAEVLEWIHPSLIIYGPDGFGDGHLIGSHTARKNRKIVDNGWDGVLFDTFTHKKRSQPGDFLPGDGALPAYSIYQAGAEPANDGGRAPPSDNSDDHFIPKRHRVIRGSRGYKRITIYTLSRGIFF